MGVIKQGIYHLEASENVNPLSTQAKVQRSMRSFNCNGVYCHTGLGHYVGLAVHTKM